MNTEDPQAQIFSGSSKLRAIIFGFYGKKEAYLEVLPIQSSYRKKYVLHWRFFKGRASGTHEQ